MATPDPVKLASALAASGAALEKAAALKAKVETEKAACLAAAGPTVDALIKAGMLAESERPGTMKACENPVHVLHLLKFAAEFHQETVAGKPGGGFQASPMPAKEAAAGTGFRIVGDRYAPSDAAQAADRAREAV
jgi:hypothetical protein